MRFYFFICNDIFPRLNGDFFLIDVLGKFLAVFMMYTFALACKNLKSENVQF